MNMYDGAIQMSIFVASAMLAIFATLVLYRWWGERKSRQRRALHTDVSRSYIQRIAGQKSETSRTWTKSLRLDVVSHLLLLLRGGERDRLKELAELDGLLDEALRLSRNLRASKRIDAIRILQQFGSAVCVARLRRMMKSDRNPDVRLNAAFALASAGVLPPPRETITMLGMFDRDTSRLDIALLRSLASRYVGHFNVLLEEDIPDKRRAMLVDALGWSGDMSVLPTLEKAAQSKDVEVRAAALRAASQLGHPSVPWVLDMLEDESEIVRLQAANSCAVLRLRSAVPRLQKLLSDDVLWVRLRAEEAIALLANNGETNKEELSK
ncbi:HEAT repeat domain-containing protein [Parasphingorhabdus flavimaris]|jgi:HEAT repeat protein|uniref:HEAT repeat domain-containing protein n=1 Tax=Parasphingorhabdus flavimaris TaxID=266812 RepID=A0ABX2N2Q5_9SPHN|nr:HEAT repeat domain-containing protein [Parasphingorhabdus flavimaris]NVD27985.1 HEAT repeat domain-containing protein [Parasphingorhabdus flavimaris]|tara:strand:- start:11899 stop:12870 length:972 start_codon:yes stop_codon:yes gene_type:complete